MKYSQVLQTSRIFPCTEKNREEVLEKVKNELSKIKTELAMQQLFEKTETEIIKLESGYQIALIISIPEFF